MTKLKKLILTITSICALGLVVPIDARRKCKKKHTCCKILLRQGDPGLPGAQGVPGPAFNNSVFAYKTDAQTIDTDGFVDVLFTNISTRAWGQSASSVFTAPETGYYLISMYGTVVHTEIEISTVTAFLRILKNNSVEADGSVSAIIPGTSAASTELSRSILVQLNAGDNIRLQFGASGMGAGDVISLFPVGSPNPETTPTSATLTIIRVQ